MRFGLCASAAALFMVGCENLAATQPDGGRPWGFYATVCTEYETDVTYNDMLGLTRPRGNVEYALHYDSANEVSWFSAGAVDRWTGERSRFWVGRFDPTLGPVKRGDIVTVCMMPELKVFRDGEEEEIIRFDNDEIFPPGSRAWCDPKGEPVPSKKWTCDGWEPIESECYVPAPETELGWRRICNRRGAPVPELKSPVVDQGTAGH